MIKILLIDDDKRLLKATKMMLEASGEYKVITASGGRAGVRAAKWHRPDLILLDITMPDMDGIEVLEELKASSRTRRIPVLMLTARSDEDALKDSLYWYADEFITKPIGAEELRARIAKRLDRGKPAATPVKTRRHKGK